MPNSYPLHWTMPCICEKVRFCIQRISRPGSTMNPEERLIHRLVSNVVELWESYAWTLKIVDGGRKVGSFSNFHWPSHALFGFVWCCFLLCFADSKLCSRYTVLFVLVFFMKYWYERKGKRWRPVVCENNNGFLKDSKSLKS